MNHIIAAKCFFAEQTHVCSRYHTLSSSGRQDPSHTQGSGGCKESVSPNNAKRRKLQHKRTGNSFFYLLSKSVENFQLLFPPPFLSLGCSLLHFTLTQTFPLPFLAFHTRSLFSWIISLNFKARLNFIPTFRPNL